MVKKRVAINGFGRIGRAFFKTALNKKELDFAAINDLGDIETMVYLLKYDSVYGRYDKKVTSQEENGKKYLIVDNKKILFIQEKEITKLPWADLKVDIVVEATGVFDSFEKSKMHVDAGAKKVVITAPAKDEESDWGRTVLLGVNEEALNTCTVSSNGSCTTNSGSPVMQILTETIGVKKAFLLSTHGYTATQNLIDGPTKSKDVRRGRAAAGNIVPTSTGAAISITKAIESLKEKFGGKALRVPVLTGSISAITFLTAKPTSVEEINKIFQEAEKDEKWKGVFKTTKEPIVSSDIVNDPYGAIIDLSLTSVVDGDLCTVFSWYDNEAGYTETLVRHVLKVAETCAKQK